MSLTNGHASGPQFEDVRMEIGGNGDGLEDAQRVGSFMPGV